MATKKYKYLLIMRPIQGGNVTTTHDTLRGVRDQIGTWEIRQWPSPTYMTSAWVFVGERPALGAMIFDGLAIGFRINAVKTSLAMAMVTKRRIAALLALPMPGYRW